MEQNMQHDNSHEYDDDCEDCQPVILDVKTGKPLPLNDPMMIAIRKAFKEKTTLIERRAWGRVVLQNSRNENDVKIVERISTIFQEEMENWVK